MPNEGRLRGLNLAGFAAAGVVLGHWLAYFVAVPDDHLRTEILAASGHGYWILAVKATLVLGFVSAGAVVVRRLDDATRGKTTGVDRFVALAGRLALVQVAAFTAMEVGERIAVGAPLAQMLGHHLLVFGLVVQVAVALASAFVLLWFARSVTRLARMLFGLSPRRPASVFMWPSLPALRLVPVLSGAGGVRGPPVS